MKITKEDAETILAFHGGKDIQFSNDGIKGWMNVRGAPAWNFNMTKYRVKPEPKEIWVNEYEDDDASHREKHKAIKRAQNNAIRVAVHYKEVIEE